MLPMLLMNRQLIKDKLDMQLRAKWEGLDDSDEFMDELAEKAAISEAKAAKKEMSGIKTGQTTPAEKLMNFDVGEGTSTGHMPSDGFEKNNNFNSNVKGLNIGLDDLES